MTIGYVHVRNAVLGAALLAGSVRAQESVPQVEQPNVPFTLIGVIETLQLCPGGRLCDAQDPPGSARIRVLGTSALLPPSLKIVMPGQYLTPAELFSNAPPGTVANTSGLALDDAKPPSGGIQAELLGNIVDGRYIVALASISPAGPLQTANGYVVGIEEDTGSLLIASTPEGEAKVRVRLNDPEGRFGVRQSQVDHRFRVDQDNPTVHAMTGYPMCIPRVKAPGDDPRCPRTNRLGTARRFTSGTVAALRNAPVCTRCDPREMAPITRGDHVTFAGLREQDAQGREVFSASSLEVELGIYTSPGANPAYVTIEESIWGTGGRPFRNLDQETGPGKVVPGQSIVTRFRIVGFTTDPSRNVDVQSVRIDPIDGAELPLGERGSMRLASVAPEPNAPIGRFRVTVDRSVFQPATREIRARIAGMPTMTLANGLTPGQYTAPVGEYIFPEGRVLGDQAIPLNVEDLCFLSRGEGPGTPALQPFPVSAPSRTSPGALCGEP